MKMKLKLDQETLKQFLLLHGEKLALSAAVIVTGMMLWSAFSIKPFDKVPGDLKGLVTQINAKIRQAHTNWDPNAEGIALPNPPYAEQVKVAMEDLQLERYRWPYSFNPPLLESKQRRGEPSYYPLEDLRVTYREAAVQMNKDKANAEFIGYPYLIVTGLIPYQKQVAEYERLFQNAIFVNPARDTPQYIDFAIERAEATSDVPDDKLVWKAIDLTAVYKKMQLMAKGPEACRPELIELFGDSNGILSRLPQPVAADPDAAFAHEPQIKYEVVGKEDKSKPAVQPAANAPTVLERPGRTDNAQAVGQQAADAAKQPAAAGKAIPAYKLFRFCDFDVERLKSYRYRVKLVLANPNKDVKPEFLLPEMPNIGKTPDRETAFSKPSPGAYLPRDFDLYAGDVARPVVGEYHGRFAIFRFDPAFGTRVGYIFGQNTPTNKTFDRGTLIGLPAVPGNYRNAAGQSKSGTVNFDVGVAIVGLTGGEQRDVLIGTTPYRPKAPGEVLFLNPDGTVQFGNQVQDAPRLESLRAGVTAPTDGGNAPVAPTAPITPEDKFNELFGKPKAGKK